MSWHDSPELPFISIVVSFHNEGACLRKCLQALLVQTYSREKYEVILVDDGSVDGSQETISDSSSDSGPDSEALQPV